MTAIRKILTWGSFLLLLVCSTLLFWMIWTLVPAREPSYNGHSFSQWAACVSDDPTDPDRFSATDDEVRKALVLLSTNNLPLLVRWIDYDSNLKNRMVWRLFRISPHGLLQTGIFDFMVTERRDVALERRAEQVFRVLGPRAAPAIPKLTQVVMKRDPAAGRCALRALKHLGEESAPALISLAVCAKNPCRIDALGLLWAHTNFPAVRAVLISAKRDPDLDVRRAAIRALNGEEPY